MVYDIAWFGIKMLCFVLFDILDRISLVDNDGSL